MKRALLVAALTGCGSFQDPDIVVDLRVIAIEASLPEQVVDVDLAHPQQPTELLAQLHDSTVCALAADPGFDRRLRYALTLCPFGDYDRCDPNVRVPLAAGLVEDPDTAAMPKLCATVAANGNLLGVLLATLRGDALGGLGGIDYLVELRLGGEDADPARDLYAAKTLRVSPRIPAQRRANTNPSLERIDATIDDVTMPLALGRCVDQQTPLEVRAGTTIRLTPIEPPGAREDYVVPTLDGSSRMFTESLTYQWTAGAGGFSSGKTGGPHDIAGNPAPLFTEWNAPNAADLSGVTDVPLWIVQRDERLGVHWYESCVRVAP